MTVKSLCGTVLAAALLGFSISAASHQARSCAGALGLPPQVRELPASALESIEGLISTEGCLNEGVYRVRALGGQLLALKLLRTYPTVADLDTEGFEIHQRLGAEGLAPRLHGVFAWPEIESRRPEFRRINPQFRGPIGFDSRLGVLMDEIVGGWNVKSPSAPPDTSGWDPVSIAAQFDSLKARAIQLGIGSFDWQFLIDPQGTVWLIDFDMAGWMPEDAGEHHMFEYFKAAVIKRISPNCPVSSAGSDSLNRALPFWMRAAH